MEEVWRPVVGYEGLYEVSNLGRVRSLDRYVKHYSGGLRHMKGKILKSQPDRDGYLIIILPNKTASKVHRLVAQAFLPNPDNLPCINHKDQNPANNRVENLEWCTYKYNNNYKDHNEKSAKSRSKTVYQYTLDGELVTQWGSTHECERETGFAHTHISACCNGKDKTAYGFRWSY